MSEYKHGIETRRKKTAALNPVPCKSLVQCVIGTAPVNTLEDPCNAVNVPLLITDSDMARKKLGHTDEIEKYTVMHSVYASFEKHAVSPIVVINVLDPSNPRHVEAVAGEEITVAKGMAIIKVTGILLDKLAVSNGADTYEKDVDYVASFDTEGHVVIAITEDGTANGKNSIQVSYSKINPEGVTDEDIIGGMDKNGVKSGIELLDETYPETGVFPGVVVVPVFSKSPAVAAVLETKVQRMYGMFNGIAFLDLDSSEAGAKNAFMVKEIKEQNVPSSRWAVPFWPMVKSDGHILSFSAFAAALLQSATAANKNIPSESIDNLELKIDGICLEDGTQVAMTQDDVNDFLNRNGVVGALRLPTWKAWGNNTAAYPESEDPIDRWLKGVTMLNYLENKFKSEYLSKIGRNVNYKLVDGIVTEYNMALNSLTPDYIAGAEIIFDHNKNPIENIKEGHLEFQTRYADYAPAEHIINEFSYDVSLLEAAFGGGTDE